MDTKFNVTVRVCCFEELTELHSLAGVKCVENTDFGYPAWYNVFIGEWTYEGKKEYQSLQQFKEQGIMKYSVGDVLEKTGSTGYLIIQGNIGEVYICIDKEGDGVVYAENELTRRGYTLKTETTKTDKTVAQIEKDLNLPAGSLTVVAE